MRLSRERIWMAAACAAAALAIVTAGPRAMGAGKGQKQKAGQGAVAGANNAFALDILRALKDEKDNLFYSPSSISTALAMTYAGARGNTADEMRKTLRLDTDGDELHEAYESFIGALAKSGKKGGNELSVANALWCEKSMGLLPGFTGLLKSRYKAESKTLDFAKNPEKSRKTINGWVEKKTKDKIVDLIPSGVLNGTTRLVLTNAIYFKGAWASAFDKKKTHDAAFTVSPGKSVTVPMMSQKADFGYAQTEDVQVLELAYKGDSLSMLVLLPVETDGLENLEASLTPARLDDLVAGLSEKEVRVQLPRFTMTTFFDLSNVLRSLGMEDAFDPGKADFSGINGERNLFISNVLHKAFVDVAVEGTEAAAATAVIMQITCVKLEPLFMADHPFLFFIRDRASGAVLFAGRVTDPTG
jgi:serpin B